MEQIKWVNDVSASLDSKSGERGLAADGIREFAGKTEAEERMMIDAFGGFVKWNGPDGRVYWAKSKFLLGTGMKEIKFIFGEETYKATVCITGKTDAVRFSFPDGTEYEATPGRGNSLLLTKYRPLTVGKGKNAYRVLEPSPVSWTGFMAAMNAFTAGVDSELFAVRMLKGEENDG